MTAAVATLVVLIATVAPPIALHERWQRQAIQDLQFEQENLIHRVFEERDQLEQERDRLAEQWNQIGRRLQEYQPLRDKMLKMARDHYRPLMAELAGNSDNREGPAYAYLGLAIIELQLREKAEAAEHLQQARELLEELVKKNPSVRQFRAALADCLLYLSQVQNTAGQPRQALECVVEASQHREKLAGESPSIVYHKAVVDSYVALARLQNEIGDAMVAIETLDQAGQMLEELGSAWPDDPLQFYLAACALADCQSSLITISVRPPANSAVCANE